ncbi:MAG: ATP-binding protein [Candidatus Cloacimonetes bacterium]|nr:ATP-binding protein [Candidatus Cloacimonadota bacterium]
MSNLNSPLASLLLMQISKLLLFRKDEINQLIEENKVNFELNDNDIEKKSIIEKLTDDSIIDSKALISVNRQISLLENEFKDLTEFREFAFGSEEIKVISLLWSSVLGFGRFNSFTDIVEVIYPGHINTISKVDLFVGLIEKNVFDIMDTHFTSYHHDYTVLMQSVFMLSRRLTLLISGVIPEERILAIMRGQNFDSYSYLLNVLKAVEFALPEKTLLSFKGEANKMVNFYMYKELSSYFSVIVEEIDRNAENSQIGKLFRKFKLDNIEKMIVLLLLRTEYYSGGSLDHVVLRTAICRDSKEDSQKYEKYLSEQSKLCKKRIMTIDKGMYGLVRNYVINESFIEMISSDSVKRRSIVEESDDEMSDNFLKKINIKQRIGDLILPHDTKELISSAITRHKNPDKYKFSDWGLLSASLGENCGKRKSDRGLLILLHGLSGTGKTYAAGAIANELKKPLIAIETGLVRSKWYGETEENLKNMFRIMREMCIKDKNSPVFLLNEADQLIHARYSGSRSIDSVENSIQSIFLEELENFPAIFIATTNLVENLDSAFSRRFHFKIEMKLPDVNCRSKIWSTHLPDSIPGAEDIDVELLAQKYNFTGGQIRLIVENACAAAIVRDGNNRKLFLDDLIKYSEIEKYNQFQENDRRIGFID